MQEKIGFPQIMIIVLLITGSLIGAGILALPVNTGLAGFIPSLVGMGIIGGAMFFTAVILGREATRTRQATFNYPSLYGNYLGKTGKWIAIFANLLILYGLLTAYLTGATTIITNLLNLSSAKPVVMLTFALIVSGLTVTGVSIVGKYNAVLTMLMLTAFAVIVLVVEGHIDAQRLTYTDWSFLPATAPIIVTAFHFHNIIPTVCHSVKWNSSIIWKTMLVGMLLGYTMNALWIHAGAGALPLEGSNVSLLTAFEKNLPATVPLSQIIGSRLFTTGAIIFSLLAITTSYLANGIGLMAFIEDLMVNHFKKSGRALNILLSFGPPVLISLIYPDIFLKAIDIVGGIGIVVLFGILPSIIAIIRAGSARMRTLGVVMALVFGAFLVLELGQEFGMLRISPSIEYWNSGAANR